MPDQRRDPVRENVQTMEEDRAAQIEGQRQGRPSPFTCPDCGGTLWQVNEPELVFFRCHVGHSLTGEALLQGQTNAAENALWYTVRTLTDKGVLAQQLAGESRKCGDEGAAVRFEEQARAAEEQARTLRQVADGPGRRASS